LAVRARHFEEGVDLTDCWDVLRHEGFEFGVELGKDWGIPECEMEYLWIVLKSYLSYPLTGRLAYWAGSYAPWRVTCLVASKLEALFCRTGSGWVDWYHGC
jgi:hypothetical protein